MDHVMIQMSSVGYHSEALCMSDIVVDVRDAVAADTVTLND